MAISDDDINWDVHWTEHRDDEDFRDPNAFDYFTDLLPGGFSVLELGCGTCKWYPAFKLAGASRYVGVDFSPVAIEIAREKFPELELYLMRAEEIEFEEEFDLTFTHTFLQHTKIRAKERLMPKIWRALKPGGLLVIQEKCDVDTPTTFERENWVRFISRFGFTFLRSTKPEDPRNGFVFAKG